MLQIKYKINLNYSRTMFLYLLIISIINLCSGTTEKVKYSNVNVGDLKIATSLNSGEVINSDTRSENDLLEDLISSNKSISGGNVLWDGLLRECTRDPSFSCIQKNVYGYLDDRLNVVEDYNVTDTFVFKKNRVDYTKYTEEVNKEEEEKEDVEEGRSDTPLEEVTDALYGKGVKFMMTHDLELKMPEMMFDGATFRVSPMSIEGNGAIVKLELIPKQEIEERSVGQGRIFLKRIQKFFKNKLMMAFLAIVLVIKMIKIKLMWVLPLIVGVATAKKILLKFLLFLFPAFSHIFKLCSYYHHNYHTTKFHQHHHHISHLHHTIPAHIPYGAAEISHPPPDFHHVGPPPSLHGHVQPDWEFSGPGLGPEYISTDIHRNSHINFKPKVDDINDINDWGLGSATPSPLPSYPVNSYAGLPTASRLVNPKIPGPIPVYGPPASPGPVYHGPNQRVSHPASQIAAQYSPALPQAAQIQAAQAAQAAQVAALQQREKEIQIRAAQLQEAARLQNEQLRNPQTQEALRIQAEQKLLAQQRIQQQQQQLQAQRSQVDIPKASAAFDVFYSPILAKMDETFAQLGFLDESCKERLVCSMYKNPPKYSPHSNRISNELSRDSTELQKPSAKNEANERFYKYVRAARYGQDQGDCLRQYPQCSINTEKN